MAIKEPGIFKSYDIRGIYPEQIDEDAVYAIGRAFVEHVGAKTVVVGRDIRESSPALMEALIKGLTDQGADVTDIGIASTPMLYFASIELQTDGAVILTASHNTREWNGLKVCSQNAAVIGGDTGLYDIRDRAASGTFSEPASKGTVTEYDIKPAFFEKLKNHINFGDKQFNVVIDFANAMGIYERRAFDECDNITLTTLYDEPDGTFPNHEANPIKVETLVDLQNKVKEVGADIGLGYDGDADRIGFVDEHGDFVSGDMITAIIAREVLKEHPGAKIGYDVRSSRSVREVIEEHGGVAVETKVGHTIIKKAMRDIDSQFCGEMSMHFFFKEFGSVENTTATAITVMNIMAATGKTLSELTKEVDRYHHSGEINFDVHDKDATIARIKEYYADGECNDLDGIKINFPDWWFLLRPSNTESKLRLNMEAKTPEMLEEKKQEMITLITGKR